MVARATQRPQSIITVRRQSSIPARVTEPLKTTDDITSPENDLAPWRGQLHEQKFTRRKSSPIGVVARRGTAARVPRGTTWRRLRIDAKQPSNNADITREAALSRRPGDVAGTEGHRSALVDVEPSVEPNASPNDEANGEKPLAVQSPTQTHQTAAEAGAERNSDLFLSILCGKRNTLPSLTAKALLRLRGTQGEVTPMELELGSTVEDDAEWKFWLEKKKKGGISEEDIDHWTWILSAETTDLAIERFISDERLKPPFLLNLLVGSNRVLKNPDIFVSLLRYIRTHYLDVPRKPTGLSSFDLPWSHFRLLLRYLVLQGLVSWPTLLPSVARLAASFIEGLPQQLSGPPQRAHIIQCSAFNTCLRLFSSPNEVHPLNNMINNWKAQKVLLDLSARHQPTLFINKDGYKAIRDVLVALPKTIAEREVGERASFHWPPFRQDFDGRDEERQPEDDLSLVVKVGILKHEAGYPDDHLDRALDALGGSVVGKSPTTQTRALLPPPWAADRASQNIDTEWAAKVKATRNSREAWRMFTSPPVPGIRPTAQVYAEMFGKLYAGPVKGSSRLLPGDIKETFPAYDGNLSALEIARLSAPGPEELYRMMLFSGVKPTGELLIVLLRNASSKAMALQYLADSPYREYVSALQKPVTNRAEVAAALADLPVRVIYAWIYMLCRTQLKPTGGHAGSFKTSQVKEAMRLATEYQSVSRWDDKVPWYIIMKYLAGEGSLYDDGAARFNAPLTLGVFMFHWERTVSQKGVDTKLFEMLCLAVRKSLRLATWRNTTELEFHEPENIGRFSRLALRAYLMLREAFRTLTHPIAELDSATDHGENLVLAHPITAKQVLRYMRTLGTVGDGKEMVHLMRWIIDAWDKDYVLEDAKHPQELGYEDIMQAINYFSRVGRRHVKAAVLRDVRDSLENLKWENNCTWFWPLEENEAVDTEVELDLGAAERWFMLREMIYERDVASSEEQKTEDDNEENWQMECQGDL